VIAISEFRGFDIPEIPGFSVENSGNFGNVNAINSMMSIDGGLQLLRCSFQAIFTGHLVS